MSHAEFVKLMRERRVGDFGTGTRPLMPVETSVTASGSEAIYNPTIDVVTCTGSDSSGALYYTFKRQGPPPPPPPRELEKRGRWNESILVLSRELMESPEIEAEHKNLADALIRYGKHFENVWQTQAALHQFRRAKFVCPSIPVDVVDLPVSKSYPQPVGTLSESKVKDRIAQMTKQLFECPNDTRTRQCLASWYVFYGDLLRKSKRDYDADLQYRCALFVDKNNIEVYKRDCVRLVIGPNLRSDESTSPLPP